MAELLAGILAVVLEEADVLDARIALQVEDALGGDAEEVRDFVIAGAPKVSVVVGVFYQHFMRADGVHAVINAVTAAVGFALDAVERSGMDDRTRGPGSARRVRRFRDDLQRRRGSIAETAG